MKENRPISKPYCVFIVVDRNYGERLSDLAPKGPVWIVDTPFNRPAVQKIWARKATRSHLGGVTTFNSIGASPEDDLIEELETIDLHHGPHSADPAYTVIEVIGVRINERVQAALADFGFDKFEPTTEGFRAVRPLPAVDVSELPPS